MNKHGEVQNATLFVMNKLIKKKKLAHLHMAHGYLHKHTLTKHIVQS